MRSALVVNSTGAATAVSLALIMTLFRYITTGFFHVCLSYSANDSALLSPVR